MLSEELSNPTAIVNTSI